MVNKLICSLALVSSLSAMSLAQAASPCKKVSLTGSNNRIQQTSCTFTFTFTSSPIQTLYNSGQYPAIFLSNPAKPDSNNLPKLLQIGPGVGLCYESVGVITATIGNTPVNISTISVWTNELNPQVDNLGAVITQWTVTLQKSPSTVIGSVYTHDTVNPTSGSELDVVTSGTGIFSGLSGAVMVNSFPTSATELQIKELSGEICLNPYVASVETIN
jgi:hypothetical protein